MAETMFSPRAMANLNGNSSHKEGRIKKKESKDARGKGEYFRKGWPSEKRL